MIGKLVEILWAWITRCFAVIISIFRAGQTPINETENQSCLNKVLANVITKTVRAEFHRFFSENPAVLCNELKQKRNELKILNAHKRGILNNNQVRLLLPSPPAPQLVESSQFDLTLLCFLLTAICYTLPPSNGWNSPPNKSDQSSTAQIVRIKLARNDFTHTTVEGFTNQKFDMLWNELRDAAISLNCNANEIDVHDIRLPAFRRFAKCVQLSLSLSAAMCFFLYETMRNETFRRYKKETGIHSRTENVFMYQERTEILNKILDDIHGKRATQLGLVISGPGGIGKTQMALAVCNKLKKKYKHVIWMKAEGEEIKDSFKELYKNLKLDLKDQIKSKFAVSYNSEPLDSKRIKFAVYDFLGNDKCLLVFDNVRCYHDIKEFMPSEDRHKPFLLITSQFESWNPSDFAVERIDVFTEVEALQYFMTYWERAEAKDEEMILKLVNRLDRLPLALSQALSFLNSNQEYDLVQYLKELEENAEGVLSEDISEITYYGKTVLTTWRTSLRKLGKHSIRLLQIMSYMNGKSIRKSILLRLEAIDKKYVGSDQSLLTLMENKTNLDGALKQLYIYSLTNETYEEYGKDREKIISVHSLVQIVVRLGHGIEDDDQDKDISAKVLIQLLCDTIDSDKVEREHCDFGVTWVWHLLEVLQICQKNEDVVSLFSSTNKQNQLKEALLNKGYYRTCNEIFQILLSHTSDSEKRIELLATISYALLKMGNYKRAEEGFVEVLKGYESLKWNSAREEEVGYSLVKMYEDVSLQAEYYIGHCMMKREAFKEAIYKLEQVCLKLLQFNGNESKQFLLAQHDIAYCEFKLAKYEEAFTKFKEILVKQEQVCGEDDKSTLLTSHSLGHCLIELGRNNEAKESLEGTLKKKMKAFGKYHHETLITHHTLGLSLMNLKQHEEASEIFQEVFLNKKKALGKRNPSTLTTQHRIGNCLMEQYLYKQALEVFEEVYTIREEVLGKEKERTLMTKNDIAYCKMMLDQYQEAIQMFAEVDAIQVKLFTNKKASALVTKYNLALCHMALKEFETAKIILLGLEKLQLEHFGAGHEKVRMTNKQIQECELELQKIEDKKER